VTSSITVLQAMVWDKLSVYDQIVSKNLKREQVDIKHIFT